MTEEIFDVAVIGAGFGGVYAAHRFRDEGLSVIGIEGASGVGGTWYHNGYPGSRVDTDSIDLYSYLFSRVIYDGWQWKERYAAQPELMEHLNWVVDKLDLRRLFRFDTWLREAQWSSEDRHWHLKTDGSNEIACRFLVMCTGNLSVPKPVSFPGLDRFKGEWLQSNRWPHREVRFKGRRVAIVGTGSSGVQAVPVVAREAEHLFVFQRTPHYAVPARNGPPNLEKQREISGNLEDFKESMLGRPTLPMGQEDRKPAAQYTPGEQRERMERQWVFGGHGMAYVFEDIGINRDSNEIAAEFVREKIRERVKDPSSRKSCAPTIPSARAGLSWKSTTTSASIRPMSAWWICGKTRSRRSPKPGFAPGTITTTWTSSYLPWASGLFSAPSTRLALSMKRARHPEISGHGGRVRSLA